MDGAVSGGEAGAHRVNVLSRGGYRDLFCADCDWSIRGLEANAVDWFVQRHLLEPGQRGPRRPPGTAAELDPWIDPRA